MINDKEQAEPMRPAAALLIPGVDTAKGILQTGGKMEFYLKILSMFCKDANERLSLLQKVPEPETLRVFITQVHSLKSLAATLGAAELSFEAAGLEAAGKAENYAFIKENLPAFKLHLEELVRNINAALQPDKAADNEGAGDLPALLPLLRELEALLKIQDAAGIDRMLGMINEKPMNAETKKALEKISDDILMSEFDSALKTVEELFAANSRGDFIGGSCDK